VARSEIIIFKLFYFFVKLISSRQHFVNFVEVCVQKTGETELIGS